MLFESEVKMCLSERNDFQREKVRCLKHHAFFKVFALVCN